MTEAKKAGRPKLITCIALKRVGKANGEMAEIGEEMKLPVEVARKLQDSFAIKVKL